MIKLNKIVVLLLLLMASNSYSFEPTAVMITADSNEIRSLLKSKYQIDGPLSGFGVNGNKRWFVPLWDKYGGGIVHMELGGSLEKPFERFIGIKSQHQLFDYDHKKYPGSFWIVNTYQVDESSILAFVHVENADGNPEGKHTTGKTRIGVAWSNNGGSQFKFLGYILSPYRDPYPSNIQGLPYIILNNNFYVYFHDSTGFTVAVAPVNEVLESAKKGAVTKWHKYAGPGNSFNSPGLGGVSKRLRIDGISHTDAACSTYNKKCYLTLSRKNWSMKDTWIRLFESVDGIDWKFVGNIVNEKASLGAEGYQYVSILDKSGADNGVVGKTLYIYSFKDLLKPTVAGYRWTLDLVK